MSDSASICGQQMDTAFGFYLPEYEYASPEAQTSFVEIEGLDGYLDLTEQDGLVRYRPVEREFRFEKVTSSTSQADVNSISRQLNKALAGKSGNMVFDDDPTFYIKVRVLGVNVSCEDNGRIVAIIRVFAQPFRYKTTETVVTKAVSGSGSVTLTNLNIAVTPTVTVDSEMTLTYTINGVEYTATIGAGSHIIDSLILFEGNTTIAISGTGTIVFTYREGTV